MASMKSERGSWVFLVLTLIPTSILFVKSAYRQVEEAGCTGYDEALVPALTRALPCIAPRSWAILGSVVIVVLFYAAFIAGWDGGPPKWANVLSAFAFGAAAFAVTEAVWAFLFGYLGIPFLWGSDVWTRENAYDTGFQEAVFVLYLWGWAILAGIPVALRVGRRVKEASENWLNSVGGASTPISALGSGVGAVIGTGLALSVIVAVASVAIFAFAFVIMLWCLAALIGFGYMTSR